MNKEGEPDHSAVSRIIGDFVQNGNIAILHKVASETESDEEDGSFRLTKAQLANADHATDFDVPLYNVWKQPLRFGRIDRKVQKY